MLARLRRALLGGAKDPLDRDIFHKLSLAAFLAWVGLGADGLSSSAYGPEEAFHALAGHTHLAVPLALAMAVTVFVISFSYIHIIELFPAGGGGYAVSSRMLGPHAGLVAGSALVIDYVLTVAISLAAASNAIFSNLPPEWALHRLPLALCLLALLAWLNLRGLKESITVLMPLFLLFIVTHAVLIVAGVFGHGAEVPSLIANSLEQTRNLGHEAGWGAVALMLMTAYSLGGGTYTGIEAVANGLGNLAEPRAQTGRRTMLYMAASLAFTACGILLCYMLWDTQAQPGRTMNAVLVGQVFGSWPGGAWLVTVTMWSEALLLVIAAQAGFLDGPNVLSNMAADSWLPHRFSNLSNRLVRENGILLVAGAAGLVLWFTGGSVQVLVVLYAINVFITFSLSQLSMCRHWWRSRRDNPRWRGGLAINGSGLALTGGILVATVILKFGQGAWVTLVITGALIALCLWIRRHYDQTREALKRLDQLLVDLPWAELGGQARPPKPDGSTAVILVNGFSGLGIHAIHSMRRLFRARDFENLIFVQIGRIDATRFRGTEELAQLQAQVQADLGRYVELATGMGYASQARWALGTDVPAEIDRLCEQLATEFVEPVFFSAKLVFARESFANRFLHHQTSSEIQRRLLFQGRNAIVLPIRVL